MPEPAGSVLFVCSRNVCRSIAAEAVFGYLVKSTGLAVEVDSAGTHAVPGCPPDPEMCAAARRRGYSMSGMRSRLLLPGDCGRFNFILAADRGVLESIRARDAGVSVCLLMGYSRVFDVEEVPFPRAGGEYDVVLDYIEDACLGLLKALSAGN